MKLAAALVLLLTATAASCLAGDKPLPPPQWIPVNLPDGYFGLNLWGINNSGVMVGQANDPRGGLHGVAITANNVTIIDVPPSVGSYTRALGINSEGAIVGDYEMTDGATGAYLYQNGEFTWIGPDGWDNSAYGINDAGIIVGTSTHGPVFTHGFLWDGSTYTFLDVPGATVTRADGINNNGLITLSWDDANGSHWALYDGSTYTPMPDVPGASRTTPWSINDMGDVAITWANAKGIAHAAVFHDGQYYLFAAPGAFITAVSGINNEDVMVGIGESRGFRSQGFKLIP